MAGKLFPAAAMSQKKWKGIVDPALQRALGAIKQERFPHALLLVGPRGMGRELLAVELASMLVTGKDPWSKSSEASRLRAGKHPDLQLVTGEGKKDRIRIDSIREIVRSAAGRPFEGRKRVWIFDGAETRLEGHAANALLKVLEEPPDHVVFLLLAENPQALLPTILSRCFELRLPGVVGVLSMEGTGEETPPEVSHRSVGKRKAPEFMNRLRKGLARVLQGDTLTAIRMAGVLGGLEFGAEICAAAALEMAAENPGDGGSELSRIAVELLEADRRIRAFSLKPERQILSILLRAGRGR